MSNVLQELTRIITTVSHTRSPAEQVIAIVDSISQVINVDVCSLYKTRDNGDLILLASHGLDHSHPVVIPHGKGLVGTVVKDRHTLNIANAADHPDYFYIPRTGEAQFHSFCASPLVDHGEVIGVLVVQKTAAQALKEEDEAFVSTLASHLAIIVRSLPTPDDKPETNERQTAIVGSPGIGIGEVIIVNKPNLKEVQPALCSDPAQELSTWKRLVKTAEAQLEQEKQLISATVGSNIEGVFTAFQLFLIDSQFTGPVEQAIVDGCSLPFALKKTVSTISDQFQAMDDPYLKARGEDIWHLGNRLYAQWQENPAQTPAPVTAEHALVLTGQHIDISDIAAFSSANLAGIVSSEGSALSHVSVIANALGVPALLGISSHHLPDAGATVIVDGNAGNLIVRPSSVLLQEYKGLINKQRSLDAEFAKLRHLPATTLDGFTVRLLTNTGLLADLTPGLKYGAQGIGLYRTEMPFLIRSSFPTEDEQTAIYKTVFDAYKGKPVYMRTLDVGADKPLPYFPVGNEENPALGWRGIRFTLDNVQLLITQLRAMLKASVGHDRLHILIPMVSATSEIDTFRALLDDAVKQVNAEGIAAKRPGIGVMIEVPGAISHIAFWRAKIDFISIGTNDLSQYLLAIDRNNHRVANRFDHVHPAIVQELYRIACIAKDHQLPTCVCGEMSADPVAVVLLVGMGMSTLSLSSSRLPKIKYLIRHLSASNAGQLLQQVLQMDNVQSIRQAGTAFLKDCHLHDLID